jgi:hypothetical protein
VAILSSLNQILYSNDPDQIPLTDIDAAAGRILQIIFASSQPLPPDLPYDTDIPDDNADIPDDPNVAFRTNAMKITRINAVAQVNYVNYVNANEC